MTDTAVTQAVKSALDQLLVSPSHADDLIGYLDELGFEINRKGALIDLKERLIAHCEIPKHRRLK